MEFSVIDFRTIIVVSFSNFRLLQVVFVIRGGEGGREGTQRVLWRISTNLPLFVSEKVTSENNKTTWYNPLDSVTC